MTTDATFSDLTARLREFIRGSHPPAQPADRLSAAAAAGEFNRLARELFRLQFTHNAAYRRFCDARGAAPGGIGHWTDIPAVPTAAFKELELTGLPPAERTVVFHSSGTTAQRPSRHFHNAASLAVYEASLWPWFRAHVLPDGGAGLLVIFLTPPPALAPHSSLAHMFATVRRAAGAGDARFAGALDAGGAWTVDAARVRNALDEAARAARPVALLGTAFNFVQLLDDFGSVEALFQLPPGSRAMETGGYKGRARTLPKAELHGLITARLGIPPEFIVCEFGMSELSSQAYDRVAGAPCLAPRAPRLFRFPPWARFQIISPETGREAPEGETGLLRVFDLANVPSVLAVQTADLAARRGDGFELVGRAAHAEPRGCSLLTA